MKVNKKNIQTNDHTISYTHIETGSKTICFMFQVQDTITISPYFIMQRWQCFKIKWILFRSIIPMGNIFSKNLLMR